MRKPVEIGFFGTSSGGGPSRARNCSSLAITSEGRACMVDCAEGTFRQLQRCSFKTKKLDTILITHLHGDHVLGLVPLLASVLTGVANTPATLARFKARDPSPKPTLNIYGPSGLRSLVRTTLALTSTQLGATYAVHELLVPSDRTTSCAVEDMHLNEVVGKDLVCEEDGCWLDIANEAHLPHGWVINVGQILHRVISFGFVLNLPRTPRSFPPSYLERLKADNLHPSLLGKLLKAAHPPIQLSNGETLEHPGWETGSKIVVLGDTSDASGVRELATGADLLIHECTNAFIPSPSAAPSPSDFTAAREKSAARGHSTPDVAGGFARSIQAKHVALNHFSTMFGHESDFVEIERQAADAWGAAGDGHQRVVAARDGTTLLLRGVDGDAEAVTMEVSDALAV